MSLFDENEKKVQAVIEKGVNLLSQNYNVKKLDAGKYERVVTGGMQFYIVHYEIEGVGHLQTMITENCPQMQMATFTLTPFFKNLPLITFDYMFSEDKGMYLAEVYELVKDREDEDFKAWVKKFAANLDTLSNLPSIPSRPAFYDAFRPTFISKARSIDADETALEVFEKMITIFIEMEKSLPVLSKEAAAEKNAICRKYVDDLVDAGGVSTELWVKTHGVDYVRDYYHTTFFGL